MQREHTALPEGYKLRIPHRDDCLAVRDEDGIAFVMYDGVEFRLDKLGRKGGSTMWHRFRCNDTKCEAVMLVRWDVLARCVNPGSKEARDV